MGDDGTRAIPAEESGTRTAHGNGEEEGAVLTCQDFRHMEDVLGKSPCDEGLELCIQSCHEFMGRILSRRRVHERVVNRIRSDIYEELGVSEWETGMGLGFAYDAVIVGSVAADVRRGWGKLRTWRGVRVMIRVSKYEAGRTRLVSCLV